ncbi:MAG: polysaccharide biosynthesis tyrosine autokinase, partial [Candidatus Methylumidiphilus sp.]
LSKTLIAAYQPFSSQAEDIRDLRSQLMLRWFNEDRKHLALVALGTADHCSVLIANLAIVFSQLGQRTLLVDANLRNPSQHRLFKLENRQGLSSMLAGMVGMESSCQIAPFSDLSVLTAGALPPNPQELLGRPVFGELMRDLARHYDVILVDTPNALLYADTQIIAQEAGAVLLVMDKQQTRMDDAMIVKTRLESTQAHILGVVLNEL